LAKLATAYLERQRKHWPKLVEAGLLPAATDKLVRQMVEDFKDRHRTGKVDPNEVRPFLKSCPKLAGNYNRYSCDNSSPTSITDQLITVLDKAHADGRFILWLYVFCDYSVTGLDPARQGYSSYKSILNDEQHFIETTYVDDFTRASRDEIEWWKLAAQSKRLSKRMIGASDGFDLSNPNSDLLITVYGLVSRPFIKGLREKVRRGMRGAARRGTCLGKQSLGFSRRVHRDENGNIVYRPDGRPRHEPCHDPATREYRVLVYELFVERNWSTYKIAKHFNELKVDGWDGWANTAIIGLLWNPSSIGVFIWNKARQEYDWEAEKWVSVKNPRSQWEVYYDPKLAIPSMDQWRAARRKLAAIKRASPLTGRRWSRNQCSATTLFSGTLICSHCGAELKLIRSTPDSKQLGCLSGHIQWLLRSGWHHFHQLEQRRPRRSGSPVVWRFRWTRQSIRSRTIHAPAGAPCGFGCSSHPIRATPLAISNSLIRWAADATLCSWVVDSALDAAFLSPILGAAVRPTDARKLVRRHFENRW
jgi:hypothetical protein